MRCVLAQIIINKVQDVLAQITRNNFFLWKDKDKNECVLAQITINKVQDVLAQITRNNFFMEEQGQK